MRHDLIHGMPEHHPMHAGLRQCLRPVAYALGKGFAQTQAELSGPGVWLCQGQTPPQPHTHSKHFCCRATLSTSFNRRLCAPSSFICPGGIYFEQIPHRSRQVWVVASLFNYPSSTDHSQHACPHVLSLVTHPPDGMCLQTHTIQLVLLTQLC
jgi:hypothetical protein